jgi:DNA-binding MarR family transcriptional regulator
MTAGRKPAPAKETYELDRQIGFLLRKANQRHVAIFAKQISDLTPPQFAALAKLGEAGPTSQNQLGVMVAMDAATIKGVIDRLNARGLVGLSPDREDRRRIIVSLTEEGRAIVDSLLPAAAAISGETLAPLNARETATLLRLLTKLT